MDWWLNFFKPLILMVFLIGLISGFSFILARAINKKWNIQWKFALKYNILKKKIDEEIVKWCIQAIDGNMNYFDAKKFLMLKGLSQDKTNETMFIFKKIYKQVKGGNEIYGRKFKGSYPEIERAKQPDV